MVSLRCSCSSSNSSSKCDFLTYLVLPAPPPDEDDTHEAFRSSLYLSLGIDICTSEALVSRSNHVEPAISLLDNSKNAKQRPLRLLRICCCLCGGCVRVNCGMWLDALRVQHASDSELYFFQAHLQCPQNSENNTSDAAAETVATAAAGAAAAAAVAARDVPPTEKRKREGGISCFRLARGRTRGSREEAWGILAGCSGPFSFRHCLTIMQRPPDVLMQNAQGHWVAEQAGQAGIAYASQAHRLFSLFCAPANEVRSYTIEERQTAILREAAAELQAYVHPKLQVASFMQEGRGLVAAEELQRGEMLMRIPASALLNVYTALVHPTFSPLAQLLLGLPAERLQQQETAMQQKPPPQQKNADLPTELQPLVDCDVVLCLFLLFLAFTCGEQGGRAVLRFLPAAGEGDAAATAEAMRSPSCGKAAAAAAQADEFLLMDSEGIVEFLGDAALRSGVERSLAKCKMMQEELLPLLQQAFPPPAGIHQGGGVLSACRAAAATACKTDVFSESSMPAGAVAAAAAATTAATAQSGSASGDCLASSCEGTDLLKTFLAQLNYTDFVWAHLILDSRSFSLPLRPLPPLQEFQSSTGDIKKAPNSYAGDNATGEPPLVSGEDSGRREDDEEDEEVGEEHRVPFLPELLETAAQDCRRLRLPVGDRGVHGKEEPVLFVRLPPRCASFVPLGDLLNHHAHGQVLSPEIEKETGCLCLRLACDVPAGSQVYAHYGPLQSWQFLAYFGFCPSSFPRLQPPHSAAAAADKGDTNGEWQFTGEAPGNPVDFLTVQVEIADDDAEYELKQSIMELQELPLCGLFSTGIEDVSWKFLASMFVSSHPSLDHFLYAGGAGPAGAAVAAAAATAAGEAVWGPTYTCTAIRNDPEAATRIRDLVADALQSVAKAAEQRSAQLDKWEKDTETAPRWVRVWGERLRIYLNNQKALTSTQMTTLLNCLSFCPPSSAP